MSEDELSRRERQIMRAIFKMESATVLEVRNNIDDPPSLNAVRTLIQILEKKGHLTRRKSGREFVYSPKRNRVSEGLKELQNVLEIFFDDSIGTALANHISGNDAPLPPDEVERIGRLIEEAKQKSEES